MKPNRIITATTSVLGAVAFAAFLVVTAPVAAQTPNIVWVASHPLQPGLPATTVAPDGTVFDPWHVYTPAELCAAYNIDRLHAEGLTGSGQTIVLTEVYGSPTALEDLQAFSQAFGLPEPDLTIIYPDGKPAFSKAQRGQMQGWAGETSLDLQWAHAVAPDAKLVLIAVVPSQVANGVGGLPNMFRGIAYAVENYPGSPISQSWGIAEQSFRSAAPEQAARFHQVYEQAAAARCTVLSASGDSGTLLNDKQWFRFIPGPALSWPASDPLVTAIGGTWLQFGWRWEPLVSTATFYGSFDVSSYLNWLDTPGGRTEAVWKEDWAGLMTPGYATTGGGLSTLFTTPDFQQGLSQDLMQGRRGVPDLSCNAAIDGGVLVYYAGGWGGQPWPGPWGDVGGTSAATPQVAGMVALANQLRSQKGKQPIGYLNPLVYTLPARDFNDIVPETFGQGSAVTVLDDNIPFFCALWDIPGFKTTAGYDLTTGLGSPNAYWFVHDLADTP